MDAKLFFILVAAGYSLVTLVTSGMLNEHRFKSMSRIGWGDWFAFCAPIAAPWVVAGLLAHLIG